MLSILEKNIGYDAKLIIIGKDFQNNNKLSCQTTSGNQSFVFTYEKNHIYKTINKVDSSGKNPLYVSDCSVVHWKTTKLNDQDIKIELVLQQKGIETKLEKVIHCLNGRIEESAA